MSSEPQLRERPVATTLPDLDAEQEIDLGHYGRLLAARWWLPVAGIALGLFVGYLLALVSPEVYAAKTDLYLGQPVLRSAGPVQSYSTNPRAVAQIVRSGVALRDASRVSGLSVSELRDGLSTKTLTGPRGSVRAGQTPLIEIKVEGDGPRKVERAANALGQRVVKHPLISGFVNTKIRSFTKRLETQEAAIGSVDRRIAILNRSIRRAADRPPLEQLVLVSYLDNAEQRRAQLVEEQADTEQDLALAEDVEKAQVIERAVAEETTARGSRNSMLVGALIGLLLGAIAAILWDPLARRLNR
jgi:uncharacterized protein involved in exopolysaccharide biosynthesis